MSHSTHDEKVIDQFTRWARPFAELPAHSEAGAMTQLLTAAAIEPSMQVLDVACGPGIVACAAAVRAAQVTGIDLTQAMIDHARLRQSSLGLANLDWRVGDAARLPFEAASFDVVMTRYSFHHMPDPGISLQEMKRVCRPGGRIVVCDATPAPQAQAAYNRMETLRDPSHASALTQTHLRALGRAAAQRPQFASLLTRLEEGDILIVTRIDRLGRDLIDVCSTVERLQEMGVRVHCLQLGGADLTSAAGKMTMRLMAVFALFERDLLIERTHAGLERARAEGKKSGRKHALSEDQRAQVRAELDAGMSAGALAKMYCTSRQTILRARAAA
jgi:DNA invertase Pin-like site-specific DNA recombinase